MTTREEAEKLVNIIRPYPGPFLYKYRSMRSPGLEDVFRQRSVYLNVATKFNDPFECNPAMTVDQSPIERQIFLEKLTRDRFPNADRRTLKKLMKGKEPLLRNPDILRAAYDHLVSTTGIYCLSEKKDDLLMWSHYSDCHRGLCLDSGHQQKTPCSGRHSKSSTKMTTPRST